MDDNDIIILKNMNHKNINIQEQKIEIIFTVTEVESKQITCNEILHHLKKGGLPYNCTQNSTCSLEEFLCKTEDCKVILNWSKCSVLSPFQRGGKIQCLPHWRGTFKTWDFNSDTTGTAACQD